LQRLDFAQRFGLDLCASQQGRQLPGPDAKRLAEGPKYYWPAIFLVSEKWVRHFLVRKRLICGLPCFAEKIVCHFLLGALSSPNLFFYKK
jgi:hypothetical protein